ncbi:MAG: putative rane-bound dehydrogenase, partial [Akkermansiaceae bacterium]|nr:putative rane-bound dehydrogenase [Akkermansiaceae bacterium]
ANHSEVRDQSGRVVVVDSGNTYRFRPDGSRFEIYSHGQTNPFGLADDDHGDFHTCDSHSRPAMLVLPGGWYEGIGKQPDGLGFAPRIMEHDHGSSAIAGLAWYGAEQFPAEFRGNTFNGNPVTHRINRDRYEWQGSSPQAVEMPDFLSCDDPWFRPVQVKLGPDGALYIADFYNSIIGHYEMPLTDPRRDHRGRGRIWRIVWKGEHGEAPAATLPDLSGLDERALTAELSDPNLTVRRMAVNELAMRVGGGGGTGGASLAEVNADPAQPPLTRTLAAFVLQRNGKEGRVDPAVADSAAASLALRVLGGKERWTEADRAAVRRALSSADARTRRSAVLAVARHPEGLLNDLLGVDGKGDPQLDYALRLALREGLSRPGGYAEVTAGTEAASQLVADVSLAVNSPESAKTLLDHLARTHFHAPRAGEHLRKALLDLPDAEAAGLEKLLPALTALPAAEQIPLAGSMAQTLAAKGGRVPGAFTEWLKVALLQGMQAAEEKVAVASLGAVRDLRDESFRQPLEGIARDPRKSPGIRVAALQALAVLPGALDPLQAALKDPAVNGAAATLLRGLGDPAAKEAMLQAMPGAAGEFATELAVGLAGDDAGTERLFDLIGQGQVSATLLRKAPVAGNLANRSPALRDRAAQLTRDLPAEDARLDGVIAARAKGYQDGAHDPRHGAEVFAANCTACHRLHGEGGVLGPNLDGIRSRGAQRLIEDILDPNRNVDPLFRVAVLETTDGATITGTNLREEGDFLTFTDLAGKPQRLPLSGVKSRGKPVASPMPPAFESVLAERDFYDLLAYLLEEK